MDRKTALLIVSTSLASIGLGRATIPTPPGPKLERICIEADGSAQLVTDKGQMLVPTDHALAVMHRSGGKAFDLVPVGLSKAIRAVLDEGSKASAEAK